MVSDRCVCWCSRQAALFTSQKAEVGAHQWAHEIRTFPCKNSRAGRLGLSSPLEVSLRMVAPALDPGPGLRLLSVSRRALAGEQGGGNLSLRPSKSWRRGWGRGGGVGWCVWGELVLFWAACSSTYTLKKSCQGKNILVSKMLWGTGVSVEDGKLD